MRIASIGQVYRSHKSRELLPILLACMRVAKRWTPTMIFRLYTSIELQLEAERQAKRLWGEGIKFPDPATGDGKGGCRFAGS